jgi:hypothetical protein
MKIFELLIRILPIIPDPYTETTHFGNGFYFYIKQERMWRNSHPVMNLDRATLTLWTRVHYGTTLKLVYI